MQLRKYMKCIQIIVNHHKCHNWSRISANRRYFSSDGNKNDDKSDKENNNENNESFADEKELTISREKADKVTNARQKLSDLLNEMKVDTTVAKSDSVISKKMAKPKFFIRKSAREEEPQPEQEHTENISKNIDKRLVVAAKVIANTLSGDAAKQTESELLQLLRYHAEETLDAKNGKTQKSHDLASVFLGIKVDKSKTKVPGMIKRDTGLADDVQPKPESLSARIPRLPPLPPRSRRPTVSAKERVNLFVSEPLGIFDENMKETSDAPRMYIWHRLMKDDVERTVIQPPSNAFEEMIRWTEQGKLWKYPINNEQGLEEEENVPFYEHVLLDHLLEGFPDKGPVRQFMELILIGLSSNPYITVERKHATVEYYRQYFKEKEDVLKASGALG